MASPSIECGNCTAACCRSGTEMELGPNDLDFMFEGGTQLKLPKGSSRQGLTARYVLDGDCGWLDENGLCSAYEDPRRPRICREFEAGSVGCVAVRLARGVPTEIDVLDLSGVEARINDITMQGLTTFED